MLTRQIWHHVSVFSHPGTGMTCGTELLSSSRIAFTRFLCFSSYSPRFFCTAECSSALGKTLVPTGAFSQICGISAHLSNWWVSSAKEPLPLGSIRARATRRPVSVFGPT